MKSFAEALEEIDRQLDQVDADLDAGEPLDLPQVDVTDVSAPTPADLARGRQVQARLEAAQHRIAVMQQRTADELGQLGQRRDASAAYRQQGPTR